jgi:glyoxylase-like metal-dependent hydrolase (beta-lactamase superfamily II)
MKRLTRRDALVACCAALPLAGTAQQATPPIGRFTSAVRAYSTNSYWIEGSDGVVLVDTQFLPSDATRFADEAQRRSGKPAKLAIVLHPNPDKFNGCAALQARGVRVITGAQVAALIPSVHALRLTWFLDDFKPDYPQAVPRPEVFGEHTTTLRVAGLDLGLHVLGGAGCSGAHLALKVGDALFVGDLVASRGHGWMELAQFDPWLERLNELEALRPARIYVGRGEPGGAELIAAQRQYLQRVRAIVREAKPQGELGRFTRWRLKQRIVEAFPGYEWDAFVWESLPEIWRQLQKNA